MQAAELQKRVQQLRAEGPQQIADSICQFFKNSRGLLDSGPTPTPLEAEQTKAMRPLPASLQASLANTSSKAPILRCNMCSLNPLSCIVDCIFLYFEWLGSNCLQDLQFEFAARVYEDTTRV